MLRLIVVDFFKFSFVVALMVAYCHARLFYQGLEVVAIELDNPFGDDANDFDNTAMALTAFEDAYLTLLDVDGPEWADKLRLRMHNGKDDSLIPGQEQRWLLSTSRPGIV
jgi:predicted membrane chloride channel (bestrophin family)